MCAFRVRLGVYWGSGAVVSRSLPGCSRLVLSFVEARSRWAQGNALNSVYYTVYCLLPYSTSELPLAGTDPGPTPAQGPAQHSSRSQLGLSQLRRADHDHAPSHRGRERPLPSRVLLFLVVPPEPALHPSPVLRLWPFPPPGTRRTRSRLNLAETTERGPSSP